MVADDAVTDLYDRHPINAAQILDAVREAGKDASALVPADLRPHDQDHYGGEAVVHELADAAGVSEGHLVADVCAGMAGPARLIAEGRGAQVIGLDYNWSRCRGASQLNHLVGLDQEVRMVQCDAQSLPLADNCLDAAISQEALLHIPDKAAVLRGVFDALQPGGRFAFTDLVALSGLSDQARTRLAHDGMQMVNLQTAAEYFDMAMGTGFRIESETDLSADWILILTERLRMYDDMADATARVHGSEAHRQYMEPYAFFVGLVQQGQLGGLRMVLQKPEK